MPDLNIVNKEVSWKVFDIPVYGTITYSPDNNRHQAVVLVAGSGPTDRDWCSPLLPGTNGSGKLLAEALANQGFVTLRYDKLASGPHVKENVPKIIGKISMQSHLEELEGAVQTMLAEKNVKQDDLFVLANSEGCIHAVNYQLQAKKDRFSGLVLTGAPGRSVGELGRSQILSQLKSLPNGESLMKAYDAAVADFLAGRQMTLDSSIPEPLKLVLHSLEVPANLPFSRELWTYNLSERLNQVKEPVLVVIGKKDIQVNWKIDGQMLEKSVAQDLDVLFVYPENANHVLKHEELPLEKLNAQYATLRYNAADAVLDQEAANAIYAWLFNKSC